MPQPTLQSVHVNTALTTIATAYLQEDDVYIANKVFPSVPVQHRSDVYFKYRKGDFFRDDFQKRADGAESAGSGWNMDQSMPYQADVWALHKDIGSQARANQDPAVDLDVAATKYLIQKGKIHRDRIFVSKYMTPGVWGRDVTGSATGTPGTTTTRLWSDDANGDPITDVAEAMDYVQQNTGFLPNTLTLSYKAYKAIKKHPLIIDRIKYVMPAYGGKITPELLASLFDVDKVVVSRAVYNSADEGATDNFSYVSGSDALLTYSAPEPGLMVPSAGYLFPWIGLMDGLGGTEGVAIAQISAPLLGWGTVRTEAQMAFDMQVVGPDLGVFFHNIV